LLGTAGGGQPGDFLLVQFGQTDSKAPNDSMTDAEKKVAEEAYVDVETYKSYLKLYIEAAREREVIPILITPLADWNTDASGAFVSSYADYAQAVRDVATEEGVHFIDLDKKSREFYATLDEEGLKDVFLFCEKGEYNTSHADGAQDKENLQIYGAVHMARLVAEGLAETGEEWLVKYIGDTKLPTAKPAAPKVTVKVNKEKSFRMQWDRVDGAQVYFVYQMVDGAWKLVKQTEGLVYNENTPIDANNSEYKVVAMNNVGTSDDSNVAKREVAADSSKEDETTTAASAPVEDKGNNILPIIIIVVVVLVVVVVVVIIVLKKRNGGDEDDDEYEEDDDEYDDDDDDYEDDDEYEDDDDEYEDDEDE